MTSHILSESAAASYLGVSRRTVQKWRFERRGPNYIRMGKSVRYHRDDLDSYLDRHRVVVAA